MKTRVIDLRTRNGKLEMLVYTQIVPEEKFRLEWKPVEEVK